MANFYDTLTRKYNACPPDCTACEDACARRNGGDTASGAIQTVHLAEAGFHGIITCNQCREPKCLEICPTGAIVKSETDGVVRVIDAKCVGCGLCSLACPYGGIYYDPDKNKAFKCDTCDGSFDCMAACEHDVLSVMRARSIQNYIKSEDLLSPGIPLCAGCPAELALRFALKIMGRNTILFVPPGCTSRGFNLVGLLPKLRIPVFGCLMTNVPSSMTGVKRYYQRIGRDVTCLAFAGDGTTGDAGFQPLSGAAERGENIVYICYDNEAFMSTGGQRTSTTPRRAATTTTPIGEKRRGKNTAPKNIPLIMAMHDIPYVATATVGYLEDYARKLAKAKAVKDGLSYIHLLSPCPTGWGAPTDASLEISRMAVETNYFPLWEAEKGNFRLTHEVRQPKPIRDFAGMMEKFRHLTEEEMAQFQQEVDARFARIKALTTGTTPESRG